VIINQNYSPEQVRPAVRDYPPPANGPSSGLNEYGQPTRPRQQAAGGQYTEPLYLLAFKDGVIRAVVAYWADKDAVHYVTMDHENRQASLGTIDRDLSERLNQERGVDFRLPRS
jgi:hypothetical protein